MSGIDVSEGAARAVTAGLREAHEARALLDDYARIVWNVLAEPGDGIVGRLVAELGACGALSFALGEVSRSDEVGPSELRAGRARWRPRMNAEAVVDAAERARRASAVLLCPGDEDWPAGADDLGDHAPLLLWARGETSVLRPSASLAIVGARAATSYGVHVAGELSAELADSGVTIVSGAAYGIDGTAHRAAITTGGATVAVLAGGVDRPYPAGHASLIEKIAESGLVLAEGPCGAAPTKWRFLARNRLIAALSSATIVVEAGARSGSLNTAAHAASLGRALGAVPGAITSAASIGCHHLLREFDAECITSADDARDLLGIVRPAVFETEDRRTGSRTRVLDALSTRVSREVSEVARHSGLSEVEVQSLLALAEIDGEARRDMEGWRRASSR